jgi:NADH-quinone oxidoreductase subunit L
LIFFLPLAAFTVITFILRPFFNNRPRWSGYATISAIGLAFVLSLWVLVTVIKSPEHALDIHRVSWVVIEDSVTINLGIIVDGLTAVMLVVVTLVSLMVQIYSQAYMHGDAGYPRYFAFMALFTANMLGLVLADSLLFLYVFWEGVGLCSYLLIGFWFHKPEAANAAKKAFIITRIGDFGFLVAILYLYTNVGTFDIMPLREMALAGTLAGTTLTWAAIGIFAGAVGKSAQFPLHTWLPDAMEGPTPVSALIHAATMVAAGVFLVARMFPLFEHSPAALLTVGTIGAFTAIFAASMGLVANDIKRVCAYSTISQLGYMMLGLSVGGIAIGMFHLFNHAFFKALLFLGAGSVNHATGTFDMRQMGGLRKAMPWTFITFVIASLSLAGIWPLAGFWSKDEILAFSLEKQPVLFYLAMVTVFMTAFYIFRAVFMTFGGQYRGGAAEHSSSAQHGQSGHGPSLHESGRLMVVPMVILAVLSIGSGWLNLGGQFGALLGHGGEEAGMSFFGVLTHALPLLSLAVAGLGVLLAYAMYSSGKISPDSVGRAFSPLYTLFYRKYWFDELYERVFVGRALFAGLFRGLHLFDTFAVDAAVDGIASGTTETGKVLRRVQSGQLQQYGLFIVLGILAMVAGFFVFG